MTTIDLTPTMNPAKFPALEQAHRRANAEGFPMRVYVAPPHAPQTLAQTIFNVWYVRRADEAAPEQAQLYQEITPDKNIPSTRLKGYEHLDAGGFLVRIELHRLGPDCFEISQWRAGESIPTLYRFKTFDEADHRFSSFIEANK